MVYFDHKNKLTLLNAHVLGGEGGGSFMASLNDLDTPILNYL
jgi:hypothetical protein